MADIKQIVLPGGGTYDIKMDGMTGATSVEAGKSGAVPAPLAGDQEKYLRGDGTWHSADYRFYVDLTTGNLMYEK